MTSVFKQLDEVIPPLDGWRSVEECKTMAAAVFAMRPETSVVIGVWGGRDTFALALAHKELGRGRVVAIDPWSSQASKEGQTGENEKWWGSVADHEVVYNRFMQGVGSLGLQDVIQVVRERSDNVTPPNNIGILSLDGNHGPQAERDSDRFAPKIVNGGLIFADDLHWEGGAVMRAMAKLKANGFRELYRIGTGAVFQRLV